MVLNENAYWPCLKTAELRSVYIPKRLVSASCVFTRTEFINNNSTKGMIKNSTRYIECGYGNSTGTTSIILILITTDDTDYPKCFRCEIFVRPLYRGHSQFTLHWSKPSQLDYVTLAVIGQMEWHEITKKTPARPSWRDAGRWISAVKSFNKMEFTKLNMIINVNDTSTDNHNPQSHSLNNIDSVLSFSRDIFRISGKI